MLGMPVGLSKTLKSYTMIWVVVDRLTKSAHFIPGKSTYTASKWGQLYMTEIVRLHGVPISIVSDRDARFTSKLNQILEDMLRACVLEFSGSWDSHLHLLEFAYNNSYQATIGMTPFETLYGPELVQTTNAAIQKIRARMLIAQSRQKSYVDEQRKDLEFGVGDMVFLKVAPMKGVLRFEQREAKSTFLHDVFHVSILRKYVADSTHVADFEPLRINENLSYNEQPIEILAREVKMLRNREIVLVKVL
ncbi:putative Retrotransposon protein, Ty3-gypsy subclass [Cucumis melo var. makuwa]|uniref:Putative Retrotransposon protein, Ty3-gypsy subclass n=1 Tax=Cucumis melo var. makuwa TaxID=1194695 RepID=A0A5D3BNH3_CUCMM|nr:putative Retrotransposon protein, Ty3-gypsy subclass [Cucumis melo var. makuwa]